jgi:[acyl-carrier-protein] S-malonyltransferase
VKSIWFFPGQGTQRVGMGKDLCAASPKAREVFDRADDALGFRLSTLCFEGPLDELTLTANAQPAILTTSTATLAALRETVGDLPSPAFAAGHSLGEYSALVAAGALDFADAVQLVRLRGEAMQAAVPAGVGAMAAIIGGDADSVGALCAQAATPSEPVSPANFNAPGQIVIAGHAAAVKRATSAAPDLKLKAIALNVSAPFHCSLMEPAARAVEVALQQIRVSDLHFPVVSNFDAAPNQDPTRVAELLVRQIEHPVRWDQSVAWMVGQGADRALEIGDGKVLAGLAKRIDKSLKVLAVAGAEDFQQVPAFLAN